MALAARKASLVEQLREHDGDRHKTDDSAWLVRREALLTEASDVLRQLEEGVPETAAEAPTTAGRKVTLAWGGGLLVFFGLAAGGITGLLLATPFAGRSQPSKTSQVLAMATAISIILAAWARALF